MNRLKPEAVKAIERGFELDRRVWQLMDLVVAEWESDPSSVACFDLRIVEESKKILAEKKALAKHDLFPIFG